MPTGLLWECSATFSGLPPTTCTVPADKHTSSASYVHVCYIKYEKILSLSSVSVRMMEKQESPYWAISRQWALINVGIKRKKEEAKVALALTKGEEPKMKEGVRKQEAFIRYCLTSTSVPIIVGTARDVASPNKLFLVLLQICFFQLMYHQMCLLALPGTCIIILQLLLSLTKGTNLTVKAFRYGPW